MLSLLAAWLAAAAPTAALAQAEVLTAAPAWASPAGLAAFPGAVPPAALRPAADLGAWTPAPSAGSLPPLSLGGLRALDAAPPGRAAFDGAARRPVRLVIAGPPGSGKGTHGRRLADEFGAVHVSAGELLRERARTDPALREVMDQGRLVDAATVIEVVRERLAQPDASARGWILDGFPRRLAEAEALARLGLDPRAVILLDVPEEELLRRILGRGRSDDSEAVFRERMRVYREQTVPAIESLRPRVPFVVPDLSGPDADANYLNIRGALRELLEASAP